MRDDVKALVRGLLLNLVQLFGVVSVLVGLAMWWPPAAWIAGGVTAVVATVLWERGIRYGNTTR